MQTVPFCDWCWDSSTQGKVRAPRGGSCPGPGPAAKKKEQVGARLKPAWCCSWPNGRRQQEWCGRSRTRARPLPSQPLHRPAQQCWLSCHPPEPSGVLAIDKAKSFIWGRAFLEHCQSPSFLSKLQAHLIIPQKSRMF